MTMPNKNSIESEIERLFNDRLFSGAVLTLEVRKELTKELFALIQREVKKGRVEENEQSHKVMTKAINDRLEELEG